MAHARTATGQEKPGETYFPVSSDPAALKYTYTVEWPAARPRCLNMPEGK